MSKVILAMSGGVDSTVAAKLLLDQGHEVVGMYMNCSKGNWPSTIDWDNDEKILRGLCKKLGIRLIVKDTAEGYEKKVISKMFKDYAQNLTPNPDTLCNNVGKFPLLQKLKKELGADYIATGHYARLEKKGKNFVMKRGKDESKDQSYFLVGLKNSLLKDCLFPLGELTKDEIRKKAKELGFENWDKRSSRGICYLGKIDMKDFLHSRIDDKEGDIIDNERDIVGKHNGSCFFTIGQRLGNDVELNKLGRKRYSGTKLMVADKVKNNLIVAPKGDGSLLVKKIKIIKLCEYDKVPKKTTARIRHLGELHDGRLMKEGNSWFYYFDKGVEGIASGQIIAIYDKDRIVAGGEMRRI
ncbi:tRNA 2-thiouridine(34) synthase MnmA [Candidatus Woesearchaeota archaeon]|nr:tRNA 2-thiouridine(34) synthase MnmA [Candidatus Woesearchaeota archaeon]